MPLLIGGADTTVSAEYAFYLAMVLFPDVQKKAQAEIDAVVGSGRLPTIADQLHLPYVNAVVSEVLRWNSVAPLGMLSNIISHFQIFYYPCRNPTYCFARQLYQWVFHSQRINDRCQPLVSRLFFHVVGVKIYMSQPRNMLHDPEIYPDPFVFNPERHLGDEPQRDPRTLCFGFGRRICPGMYLAEASIFSCIAMSLAVFKIEKVLDENGLPITPVHENMSGAIRCVYPSSSIVFSSKQSFFFC